MKKPNDVKALDEDEVEKETNRLINIGVPVYAAPGEAITNIFLKRKKEHVNKSGS